MGGEARHPFSSTLRDMSGAGLSFARLQRSLVGMSLALALVQQTTASPGLARTSGGRRPISPLISAQRIGGLQIGSATYERAVRQFGAVRPPVVSATFPSGSCRLIYRDLGLGLYFARLDTAQSAGTPATCRFFFSAIVTSSAWQTSNGLRVGEPLRSMLHLFPMAHNTKLAATGWDEPAGSTWWWLNAPSSQARQAILVAYVKHGRVAGLGVNMVGH
jgi:hypothetical protein